MDFPIILVLHLVRWNSSGEEVVRCVFEGWNLDPDISEFSDLRLLRLEFRPGYI